MNQNFPQFGTGEVTNFREAQVIARLYFLVTAEELYPGIRSHLEQLGQDLPTDLDFGSFWVLRGSDREAVLKYCRTWGLVYGREPAEWACEMVVDTVAQWRQTGQWFWFLHAGYATALNSEDFDLGDGFRFNPHFERRSKAKERIPRRLHPQITGLSDRAVGVKGFCWTKRGYTKNHFHWTVRHQIGNVTYRELAAELAAAVKARHTTNGKRDERDVESIESIIKEQVKELKRLIALQRTRGRRAAR